MSVLGPSRRIAALQFFGRNWGHSGHRVALEPEDSGANDPCRTPNVGIAHRVLAKDLRRYRKAFA
jgi:hypothetical protein